MQRRNFFRSIALGSAGAVLSPVINATSLLTVEKTKPDTNIAEATAIPRTKNSMPGKYPGKVIKTVHPSPVKDGKIDKQIAYDMLKTCMLALTGEKKIKKAWRQFIEPKDIIGIKVNPIAGKLLTTSHAIVQSIIEQLEESGIPRENLIIWDRREFDLREAGFTPQNYPGIKIIGTEYQDEAGSYISSEGKFYSENRIDKNQYFYADVEGEYDAYTMPYMVNGGKNSYFSTICTEMVTKIINVPVLKNAGSSVTLCMKNLAFGSITNTARLHQSLWNETCAYACAFPPLRDKLVLNIVDGLIGCFDGGPAANPQFICHYNTILAGTDPVATDRIGYEIVLAKRIEEGIQSEEKAGSRAYMELAQNLKLGIANKSKIELKEINLQA